MAERVGGVGAGNPEHDLFCGSDVVDDDLRVPGVAVPLERHRVTVIGASVEFNEHGRDLSGVVGGRP